MRAQCLAKEAASRGLSAATASRRHMTTRSTPGRAARSMRKLSRTRRLRRLRSTARRAHFLAMASPNRGPELGLRRARTVKYGSMDFLASSKTCWNWALSSSRAVRGRPSPTTVSRRMDSGLGVGPGEFPCIAGQHTASDRRELGPRRNCCRLRWACPRMDESEALKTFGPGQVVTVFGRAIRRSRGNQGVRRARPLARRACRTLRPLRVALRARKPWVRARLMRLG